MNKQIYSARIKIGIPLCWSDSYIDSRYGSGLCLHIARLQEVDNKTKEMECAEANINKRLSATMDVCKKPKTFTQRLRYLLTGVIGNE